MEMLTQKRKIKIIDIFREIIKLKIIMFILMKVGFLSLSER